jgi:hypothetical protein
MLDMNAHRRLLDDLGAQLDRHRAKLMDRLQGKDGLSDADVASSGRVLADRLEHHMAQLRKDELRKMSRASDADRQAAEEFMGARRSE